MKIRISRIDKEKTKEFRWYINSMGYFASYNRKDGKHVLLHRIVMDAKKGEFVDHIDGDKLNNLRSNLRICTKQQNHWNSHVNPHKGTSKYKGVHYYKAYKKWMAKINPNGKCVFLGYFEIEEDAAKAYNKAAKIYFGEYARLNIC